MTGWHLDKRISISQIIAIIGIIIAAATGYYNLRQDINRNSFELEYVKKEIARSEERSRADIAEIKASLRRIEDKLDTKADR